MITNAILQQMTGAVSFRRWLGCAPTIVARAPTPPPPLKRPRHRFLNNRRRANGPFRTTLGSRELAAPRPHETFTAVPLHDGANSPDGRVRFLVAVCGVVLKNSLAVFAIAQPNGVRLSCAAVLCRSQLQFYYDGRRQLQPLVRLRADDGRSDPSLPRNPRSTRRIRPRTAGLTPAG